MIKGGNYHYMTHSYGLVHSLILVTEHELGKLQYSFLFVWLLYLYFTGLEICSRLCNRDAASWI